ncbi:MAG: putative cytochrome P450 hydroxylase, partial [uncultured Solirubrobacterales bacterium]
GARLRARAAGLRLPGPDPRGAPSQLAHAIRLFALLPGGEPRPGGAARGAGLPRTVYVRAGARRRARVRLHHRHLRTAGAADPLRRVRSEV